MFARHVRLKLAACTRAFPQHEKPQTSTKQGKQFNNLAHHPQPLTTTMDDHRTPEWTCSEVIHLINEYGKRPELWDPDCEDYKNRFKKHHRWVELAAIFKCSKLEVERKMKILNSQYRRERLKAVRMRKMGKTHRVTWYGYKAFGFMGKHWVRYRNRSNLMASSGVVKQESSDHESRTELIPFLDEDEEPQDDLSDFKIEDPVVEKGEGVPPPKDEWGLFGELVAHAFRKLPNDRTRCIVKHKINTVLYEAEIATYD